MNTIKKIVGSLFAFSLLIFLTMTTALQAQVKKPATAKRAPVSKPAAKPATAKKAPVSKPSNVSKPAAAKTSAKKPTDVKGKAGDGRGDISGNKVNIDNSRGDVNINIDNSKDVRIHNERNTQVRHNNINSYHNPPYRWGGNRLLLLSSLSLSSLSSFLLGTGLASMGILCSHTR